MANRGRGAWLAVGLLGATPACQEAKLPQAPSQASSAVPRVAAPAPREIRRTLIASQPATGLPGWETRIYLIEYPPGVAAPAHVHPVVGVGLVLSGRFESAFGDEAVVAVRAGEGFVDKAETVHRTFRNPSADEDLRFVVAYTIRAGEAPLRPAPVDAPPH